MSYGVIPGHYRYRKKNFHRTVILDISPLAIEFDQLFPYIKDSYILTDGHYDDLYEWSVLEAFQRSKLYPVRRIVNNHYKNDLYEIIYDHLQHYFESYFRQERTLGHNDLSHYNQVKAVVAGQNLIIVFRGTTT